jgi:hypothetical protein
MGDGRRTVDGWLCRGELMRWTMCCGGRWTADRGQCAVDCGRCAAVDGVRRTVPLDGGRCAVGRCAVGSGAVGG